MKIIHMFIASSVVEFEQEREALGNYIRMLNDIYLPRNIYFMLDNCEGISSAVELKGKQNQYNDKIREADYFYVIFGKKAGEYTLEEFDVAMEQFRATGKPRIYTYFQQFSNETVSEEVLAFMQRLDRELGHYYSLFTHIDSIKLNILLELARDPEIGGGIGIENGQVCLDGDRVLSLANIPVYAKNAQLNSWREQMAQLDEAFATAAAAYGADPGNGKLMQEMMELGHKRGKLADLVRQMEQDILELYDTVSRLKSENRPLSWWEQQASRLLELGNSEGALQILRDIQLQKEMDQAKELVDTGIERIRSAIHAKKMAIQVLRTRGLTAETVFEINEIYDLIVQNAEAYHIEMDTLYDYASFAHDQHDFTRAEQLTRRLIAWYRYTGQQDASYRQALTLQSILFATTKQLEAAEKGFLEVLQLCKAADDPEETAAEYANALNSLGMLLCTGNRLEEAEQYSLEAVRLLRERVQNHPSAENRCSLANHCDTLSQIYNKMDRAPEAQKLSAELYGILKELVRDDPEKYRARYAKSCAHYSLSLTDPHEVAERESLQLEALDIFQKLARENPGRHLPNVVWIMDLLGGTYYGRNNEKAYQHYCDAYDILMKLPETEREHYPVNTTNLCSNLAVLLVWRGEKDRAEQMMLQVLSSLRKLYAKRPDLYLLPLVQCHNNLMNFYKNAGQYQKAIEYARESSQLLEAAVTSQETPPSALLDLLATVYRNMGSLFYCLKDTEAADTYTLQSRYIWGRLRNMYGPKFDSLYFQTSSLCAPIYERQQNPEKAEQILTEAYQYYLSLGEPCFEIGNISAMLLKYYFERNELDLAEQILREVLAQMKQGYLAAPRTYALSYAQACNNLAANLSRRENAHDRLDELCSLYGETTNVFCRICEDGDDQHAQHLLRIYQNLLNCLKVKKDTEGILTLLQNMADRLLKWSARNPAAYEPLLAMVYYDYANTVSHLLKDTDRGRQLLQKSLALCQKHPQLQKLQQQVEYVLKTYF